LWDAEIRGIKRPEIGYVPFRLKRTLESPAEVIEHCVQDAPDILDHDRTRPTLVDDAECLWEQVAFVPFAKLLSRNRERGAREASGQKIDTAVGCRVEVLQIRLVDATPPIWAVRVQRTTAVLVDLHQRKVIESSTLNPERLSAGTGTQFD
jgi:hypothetical protein